MNQYDHSSLSTQFRIVTSLDATLTSPQVEQFTITRVVSVSGP